MPKIGQLFTSGQWLVKPGKEAEFISAWNTFAHWTGDNQAGVGSGHLLQDTTNSRSFLSFFRPLGQRGRNPAMASEA